MVLFISMLFASFTYGAVVVVVVVVFVVVVDAKGFKLTEIVFA